MTTESRGAHEPARSKFSQQQLPATRPVLSPAFTGRVAIALAVSRRFLVLPKWADDLWQVAAGFIVPGLIGWLIVTVVQVYIRAIELRYDIAVEDNLRARRRRTRTARQVVGNRSQAPVAACTGCGRACARATRSAPSITDSCRPQPS